jgi:hypothetical protein
MTFKQTIQSFLKELKRFDYDVVSADFIWKLIFPDANGKWYKIHVVNYHETYYFTHIDGNSCPIELNPEGKIKESETFGSSSFDTGRGDLQSVWNKIIVAAHTWMGLAAKDWIRANGRVLKSYPLNRRIGKVPNSIIRAFIPDIIRIDKALGATRCRKFIRLVEDGYFSKASNTTVPAFTANKFFDYCRIAYCAAERKDDHVDKTLSGREMYERYADGRHEGLLEIDGDSEQEFADWIDGSHPKKTSGGHPWEIKRGGNTTHINLSVFRPYSFDKKSFCIQLQGEAINRQEETIRMFLALHDASLPISIANPEGIRKRLLGQDTIGIIPCFDSLHRANQHFGKDECVFDVMYYDDLGRFNRRILPYITWEPLPVFKLRDL